MSESDEFSVFRKMRVIVLMDGPPGAILELLGEGLRTPPAPPGTRPMTVLAMAIPSGGRLTCNVALELLRAGVDPVDSGERDSILVRALMTGMPQLVRAVVEAGGGDQELTPAEQLMLAACLGDVDRARALLDDHELAADCFVGCAGLDDHATPLLAAARGGFSELVDLLLERGWSAQGHPTVQARVRARKGKPRMSFDQRPGHQAAFWGHGELARRLGGRNIELAAGAYAGGHRELAHSFDAAFVAAQDERAAKAAAARKPEPPRQRARSDSPELTSWREELALHRRDWVEWAELERRASELWSVSGHRLTHERAKLSIDRDPRAKPPSGVPPWLSPLRGLRPRRDSLQTPALFAWIHFGRVRVGHSELFPELEFAASMPSDCYALTMTASGGLIMLHGADAVGLVGHRIAPIGPLEIFVRYAIRCTLDAKEWSQELARGSALDRYPLKPEALPPD